MPDAVEQPHGRTGAVAVFDDLLSWMRAHGRDLVAAAEAAAGYGASTRQQREEAGGSPARSRHCDP